MQDASGSEAKPLDRARCYREAAVHLESVGRFKTAEILHRAAGLILAAVPLGGPGDKERVRCALSLAANLSSQHRHDDARAVLVAALALAEGCLGTDDRNTRLLRRWLERAE